MTVKELKNEKESVEARIIAILIELENKCECDIVGLEATWIEYTGYKEIVDIDIVIKL